MIGLHLGAAVAARHAFDVGECAADVPVADRCVEADDETAAAIIVAIGGAVVADFGVRADDFAPEVARWLGFAEARADSVAPDAAVAVCAFEAGGVNVACDLLEGSGKLSFVAPTSPVPVPASGRTLCSAAPAERALARPPVSKL